ncbi:MAG: phosphate ABC transporter permease, partial [Xenococcaceae cyanobacterium]
MLVPLTRQKFEQLIPRIATGDQYRYVWGNFSDFLRRLLASVVAVIVVLLLRWL